MRAALPKDEPKRLQALLDLHILDTEEEVTYDAITALASTVMQTPTSLISLIDENRQWFKSKIGIDVKETHRDHAFCAHAILNPFEPLIVGDATKDERFADNPDVLKDNGIRFYLGVPLLTEDNLPIGTLCVVDHKVRDNPTLEQIESLKNLSRLVMSHLELRKFIIEVSKEVEKFNTINTTIDKQIYLDLNKKCDLILERIKVRKKLREERNN